MNSRFTSRSPWRRGLGLTVLLGALLLPACENTPTDIPGVARADIVLSVVPDPVIGVQNPLTGAVSASYAVNVREQNGLGGKIQFLNATLFDPANGRQVATNYYDSADLIVFVGTDRLEPLGELDITQTTSYVLSDLGVDADLVVAVQFLDDRGGLINRSLLVPVVPPPAE